MSTGSDINDTPAIAGGTPAKTSPFGSEKRYEADEWKELQEALEQGTLFYAYGKKVFGLEADFAKKNGVKYAVACSSGTSAIHTAMIAAGISPGDEVITAPITDMGSIVPILFQGGVPVFADLHPHSLEMSPESVEAAITPKTRAVLAIHLWGNACDLDPLIDICKRHNLLLIEDCAQAFGCLYKGKPVGTFGDIGCFSLNEFKHIACGDGGITITNDENIARRLRLSTDKCYSRESGATERNPFFLANNYRMTELQGAVAIAQLKKLDSIVSRRQKWCKELLKRLSHIKGIALPEPTPGCDPSWWFFPFRVIPEVLKADADQFVEALTAEGLSPTAHYIGRTIYQYPIFKNHSAFERGDHPFSARSYTDGMCPTAEDILKTVIILPINEAYTEDDLNQTVLAFEKVANWFSKKA
ncbi:MAG TPA: DegT/DnrJ/EryC1/StrS family aminotransferase [Armatimonadota bacterium]